MYTPAVTIVAAWISAETGVGPSIASGSHTYRGSCADFPQAPTNSSRVAAVIIGSPNGEVPAARRSVHVRDTAATPSTSAMKNMPSRNPASPMRFTMNALLAASLADLRWK